MSDQSFALLELAAFYVPVIAFALWQLYTVRRQPCGE